MRLAAIIAMTCVLPGGCGTPPDPSDPVNRIDAGQPAPAPAPAQGETVRWEVRSSAASDDLLLSGPAGEIMRLSCPSGGGLRVEVPGFRPIPSEERLSFGSGGVATALVADPRGEAPRGGVSGTAPVPDNLAALIAGPISASYGAQTSGPHPSPSAEHVRTFVAACGAGGAVAEPPAGNACLVQGDERLQVAALRAIGTEPFWGARIEGRCVTYSHPDDQAGTRVWTRFTPAPGGGSWTGALAGRRFHLVIRPQPGCSDGMSDRRYPLAVELEVGGEQRRGCAEPVGAP